MYASRKCDAYALAGRILMSIIFIVSACAKIFEWDATIHMMRAMGLPAVPILLGIATFVELIGGLAILFGIYSRISAVIMVLYLIPVTLIMHNFWSVGPVQMSIQLVNFLKNLSIMGGLLMVAAYGPGRFSMGGEKYLYEDEYVPPRTEAPTTSGRV